MSADSLDSRRSKTARHALFPRNAGPLKEAIIWLKPTNAPFRR
jgi:hypothetical protein